MTNPLDGIEAYPLTWPVGWERIKPGARQPSRFATRSVAAARNELLYQLRLLGARNVIISTNIPLRQDGLPRSGVRAPEDPGVAVYFLLRGQPRVLACDKWPAVEENLWAIKGHIAAMRDQARYGVGSLDQAFSGYAALPAPKTAWWEVLGVERGAALERIQSAYRRAASQAHPDAGGSNEEFLKIQAAWEAALKERGQ